MMNEFDIIKTFFRPLANNNKAARNLEDDAALIPVDNNKELVVTKDVLVEDVHFIKSTAPDKIAEKLFRVNLSDLAAMGALPYAYFLGITLPKKESKQKWYKQFAKGVDTMQGMYGGDVLGGDITTHNGPITLSLTAMGYCKKGKALCRNSGKPNEDIYVTGYIGDSFLGLRYVTKKISVRLKKDRQYITSRYELPEPRIYLANKLQPFISAATDISDGVLADCMHICSASEIGAKIDINTIPLSPVAQNILKHNTIQKKQLLTAGDDYELLFTAPKKMQKNIEQISKTESIAITKIGETTNTKKLELTKGTKKYPVPAKLGFQHN